MSKSERASRIAKVIRIIGCLILGVGLLGFLNADPKVQWLLLIISAVFAAPCFAVAWIVDGFARK